MLHFLFIGRVTVGLGKKHNYKYFRKPPFLFNPAVFSNLEKLCQWAVPTLLVKIFDISMEAKAIIDGVHQMHLLKKGRPLEKNPKMKNYG